ncbi:hypothetical protein F5B20DRAFT_582171 [Whalleya microplaca]|nr:hypothetical protein F5B20DRAFT_582171 [Whalleya microplaca]
MSNLKLTPTISKTRDPPPSLFLHPSPSASHVSLPGTLAVSGSAGLPSAASSTFHHHGHGQPPSATQTTTPHAHPPLSRTASLLNARLSTNTNTNTATTTNHRPRLLTADSARTADRTDALWAEMQATLEEVELSASGGTHVFGPEHDRKLGELRTAQIALAQAWARSEADDAGIDTEHAVLNNAAAAAAAVANVKNELPNIKGALGEIGIAAAAAAAGPGLGLGHTMSASATGRGASGGGGAGGGAEGTDGARSTMGSGSAARPGSSGRGGERLGAKLEEETERDILLARNRREANDRYFGKVDQGVRDVVERLEEVAVAMQAVEEETRNIWGDANTPGSTRP